MKEQNLLERPNQFVGPFDTPISDIDLNPILEECMGDMALLQELVDLYHRNALEFIGAAKIHLPKGEFSQLGQVAHKIKTGLAMMRTPSLHAIVGLIQRECKGDQDEKHLKFLCECFAEDYAVIKTAIKTAMTELENA